MKEIKFKRLFRFLTEKDEGYVINSICYYAKRPEMVQQRILGEAEAREKGFAVIVEPLTYKCAFFLDLWIVTLFFQWTQNA